MLRKFKLILQILRGRPVMYKIKFTAPVRIDTDTTGAYIFDCTFTGTTTPKLPYRNSSSFIKDFKIEE